MVGISPFFLRWGGSRVAVARLTPDIDGASGVGRVSGGLGGGNGWRSRERRLDERVVTSAPGAAGRGRGHLLVQGTREGLDKGMDEGEKQEAGRTDERSLVDF